MICPLVWVGCSSLLLLLCYCQFLLLCLLVFVLCIEVLLCWVHRYLQLLYLSLRFIPWSLCSLSLSLVTLFILRSILSDMKTATPALFSFLFTWNIFSHLLTFSQYVSLGLKFISCGQHIYGSCFYIHSASLCLLDEHLICLHLIIDIYIYIFLLMFCWLGFDFVGNFPLLYFLTT